MIRSVSFETKERFEIDQWLDSDSLSRLLEQMSDNSLFELRWKFSGGKRQIDNVYDDRCKNMATLLEERHRNRIKIALFVRCLIDESGDFI
jgi:hypothetical protein